MSWIERIGDQVRGFALGLSDFPWRNTVATLRERFRADQLGLTAGSLTFTTTIALVPLVTVALAVFSAFPMFSKLQEVLQKWFIDSLVPDNIARQVLGYVTQFSGKASRLGWTGFVALCGTALATVLTIDRSLNKIWRVRHPRPLGQRVLIYWAVMTLGPLLLAASLSVTSYAITASRGIAGSYGGALGALFNLAEFVLLVAGVAGLYRYLPNSRVLWSHALCGSLFVAIGVEAAKRLLALYLGLVPTYSVIYGAFATVPILLVWIYLLWVIVLLGAVIAAYLPSLLAGVARRGNRPGWVFQLCAEALQVLDPARARGESGTTATQLARRLQVDLLMLEPVLDNLKALRWLGQVSELEDSGEPRYVLLADPAATRLAPLLERVLVEPALPLARFWRRARLPELTLADLLEEQAHAD
jgi:membrane protein